MCGHRLTPAGVQPLQSLLGFGARRCIVRIVGLGFRNGDEEDSILNDSLFMAQVCFPQVCKTEASPAAQCCSHHSMVTAWRDAAEVSSCQQTRKPRDALPHCCSSALQELCNGGSLRELVLQQMNRYNKVQLNRGIVAGYRAGLRVS